MSINFKSDENPLWPLVKASYQAEYHSELASSMCVGSGVDTFYIVTETESFYYMLEDGKVVKYPTLQWT